MNTKTIADLIPKGRENAILLNDLGRVTGLNTRTVKRLVQDLRDDGEVILSSAGGGYFYPTEDERGLEEVTRYINMMEQQAKSRFVRIRSAERWQREYGQVRIEDGAGI